MTPVPLTLPLRPAEAAEIASLIFDQAEGRPLTDEVRNRIAARLVPLRLESFKPCLGSLARDPVHHSTYYLAVDVADPDAPPQLLHIALATAPTSGVFRKPLLIGRVRRAAGPEVVINAIPFGPSDVATLEKYVTLVDGAFAPRPRGTRDAALTCAAAPGGAMAAAFEAFRKILKRTGKNVAALEMPSAAYDAALWAAVRAGWRDGYSAAVTIRAEEGSREAIRDAARFTRFRIDAATLLADVAALSDGAIEERSWIAAEFAGPLDVGGVAYEFAAPELTRLAARFAPALKACERLHEWIREARSVIKAGKGFDCELALPLASAKELVFCLHWLKARDRAVQFVDPGAMPTAGREPWLREFAAVARHYACLPSVDASDAATEDALETVARATAGRVNLRISSAPADPAGFARHLNGIAEILLG